MRKFSSAAAFFGALVAAFFAASPTSGAEPPSLDRARVSTFVDSAVTQAMNEDHIAGVSVAVVDRLGVVLARGYGAASLSPQRGADADTLFRVGSLSKTAVWIAVMQLVQAGKISLDDPINNHLPQELRIPDEGFKRPILVRHLMSHSAGFEDSILQDFFFTDPARMKSLTETLRTHRVHRVREPGLVSAYSNYGAALAGAMVEYVSGETWQDYAERHVLRPLGMTTATYREPYSLAVARARDLPDPMPAAIAAKVSNGLEYGDDALQPQSFEYITDLAPAGALSASANDMALYLRALLDPAVMAKAGVLRADTFKTMLQPLFGNDPRLGQWRHGFMDFTADRGRPSFGHHGDLIHEHSTLEVYPDAGVAIFVSVNTPTGIPLLETLPADLMNTFVGPAQPHAPRLDDPNFSAAKVAGTYVSLYRPSYRTEAAIMRELKATQVAALSDGDILQGGNRFQPIGGGLYERTDGAGRIAFGQVDGRMRLYESLSLEASDRVGYFETMPWLQLIVELGGFVALWGVATGAIRLFRPGEPPRRRPDPGRPLPDLAHRLGLFRCVRERVVQHGFHLAQLSRRAVPNRLLAAAGCGPGDPGAGDRGHRRPAPQGLELVALDQARRGAGRVRRAQPDALYAGVAGLFGLVTARVGGRSFS
jgi:CubicO group peptidase (beta-lactamase class C family)